MTFFYFSDDSSMLIELLNAHNRCPGVTVLRNRLR